MEELVGKAIYNRDMFYFYADFIFRITWIRNEDFSRSRSTGESMQATRATQPVGPKRLVMGEDGVPKCGEQGWQTKEETR